MTFWHIYVVLNEVENVVDVFYIFFQRRSCSDTNGEDEGISSKLVEINIVCPGTTTIRNINHI